MKSSRWLMLVTLGAFIIFIIGCAATQIPKDSNRTEIMAALSSKARAVHAYAQDYVMDGMRIKRMYYQFEKDGRPFYRFREDLVRGGKPYVYIYNADGEHDYHYFPEAKTACRCPTSGAWNDSNYAKARDWHFGYDDAGIDGEMIVSGESCYLLTMRGGIYAVSMKTGMPIAKMNREKDLSRAVYYENMAFDLNDDVFDLPPDVAVTDRETCGNGQPWDPIP